MKTLDLTEAEFLTDQELQDLTGRKQKQYQIAWLEQYRWTYTINASGQPKVNRYYCRKKQGCDIPAQHKLEPNFSIL